MTQATQPRLIEIFRAGRHTDMHGRTLEFTAADLKTIADGYDPQLQQAPVVVGHPKLDAPAYGWIDKLVAQGDSLFAVEAQVDTAFADLRKAGKFKNRSASFFMPDAPNNPKPGQFHLKHVGWLGAAAPAVAGLKQVAFAADEEGVVEFALNDRRWGFATAADLFRRVRDYLIDSVGLEKADEVIAPWQIESLRDAAQPDRDTDGIRAYSETIEDTTVTDRTAEFAQRDADLKKREDAIAADEQRIAERQATDRRDDCTSFADGLVKAGKLLPAQKATVVELLFAMPVEPLSFADGDTQIDKPAAELFRGFLDSLPKQIDFAEKSHGTVEGAGEVSFAAPQGSAVDADQLALHGKAKAYQAQHPNTSWLAAVKAVGG